MASGASGRTNSGSKGFDFASDDFLCSYDSYGNQETPNGGQADTVIGTTSSSKDFQKIGMQRSSVYHANSYSQPEDTYMQDVTATVEKTMKKYADNLMHFLEGISSRLSQLELYCYNLDKSIGEMHSALLREHGEADAKLKSVEKHLQEVRKSVQIIRDKQELSDTQKELAKLQVAHKDSSGSSHSHSNEERVLSPTSDPKRAENAPDVQNQQLALALPHQAAPQPTHVPPAPQAAPQNMTQQQAYRFPPNQMPNPQTPSPGHAPTPANALPQASATITPQHPQAQYVSSDAQYKMPQMQEISRMPPQSSVPQAAQVSPMQPYPQYQQQWQQQMPQQQSSVQPHMRPPSSAVYPHPYIGTQSANQSPPEAQPSSAPMQVPYTGIPQSMAGRSDTVPYGYSAPGRTAQQQLSPQQIPKGNFGPQPSDGYAIPRTHSPLPQGSAYVMYESDGGSVHHSNQQPHFSQGGYSLSNAASFQSPQSGTGNNPMGRGPTSSQFVHSHPYNDLIEKLVSMGFRGDHVVSVIHRMEETGQPVDFNGVLDRLNAHSSGGFQRGGW